ncbi:hypothetical protein BDA96_05G179100 [Sorghum bicolor]|uniref:Uncharacterized protein n=1 Tax=Sorghum bicolor TaxID=4558 RepID=A0A921QZ86_SORBI|nr:hypothetical protein BDA96_05G179100 [Sorghum bicolor]
MKKYQRMDVACMDGFKVLKLPYKPSAAPPAHGQLKRRRGQVATNSKDTPSMEVNESTRYSMFVFLPDARGGMATMVDVVTASPAFMYSIFGRDGVLDCGPEAAQVQDNIQLGEPQGEFCQLGLTLPFSLEAADLRGMCNGDEGEVKSRRGTSVVVAGHRLTSSSSPPTIHSLSSLWRSDLG